MRLIDADELIFMELRDENDQPVGIEFVPAEFIREAPTIEAEPIIRCKDCKLNDTWDCPTNWNADEKMLMDDDDFCSYGERVDEVEE